MMEVGLEFVLHGVDQEPDHGGINPAIGITNCVGHLTRTIVRNDANNNGGDASAVQGPEKKY